MAQHVDTYFDEWRATLEDPEKLRRFVSFVNAPDAPDPSIEFVTERDQIRPVIAGATLPVGVPGALATVGPPEGDVAGADPVRAAR